MATAVISAAISVLGKALAPLTDPVLEAWAASKDLGPNVDALKTQLLSVQSILEPCLGKEINNKPLVELLHKLQVLSYRAQDVLDELDYFRIQDKLDGTNQAADELAKGCARNLVLTAGHTAKAVGKQMLSCLPLPACSSAAATGARQRATGNTIRTIGKSLICSSLPPVLDDDADHSEVLIPHHETPKLAFDRVGASKKMKNIQEQMKPICEEVSKIVRTVGSSLRAAPEIGHSRTSTIPESVEPKMYGRDLIMNSIVHDITKGKYSDKDALTVLPIFGQPGIGKTTLTQHIYQNKQVQRRFEVMVWKCVSLSFNVDKLLEDIVECIPAVEHEKVGTKRELVEQRLKSKRFLLVLDDMWKCSDKDEWRKLLLPFQKSQAKGNIIIVTTRFPGLAEIVKTTNDEIELEGLERKYFEELFLAFVFDDEQSRKDHRFLREIGEKIMDKLKGSPLAAKSVGKLLRKKLDLNHWTRVLESKEWELATDENDIMPALKLSYDYLPFHLQQCFLYCALFPEDYKFDKKTLIYFWIGQDILQPDRPNKSIEDIGLGYLDDLVTNGFLIKEEKKEGHSYYLIHDLFHDLALQVASSECLVIDRGNVWSLDIKPSVRHLCIHVDHADDGDCISYESAISQRLEKELKIERLQTLMVFGKMDERFTHLLDDLIKKANGLRVLHLSEMCSRMEISTLPHLRYLSLGSIYGREIYLPIMLSRLYHLRILDLEKWHGSHDLPRDMSNLRKLGHFLTKDDEDHSKICNVEHLQFLRELKRFRVNKENSGFEPMQLGSVNEIRELGIYNLEKIHSQEEAIQANMKHKRHLEKLRLDWSIELPKNERDIQGLVIEKLEPQRNLQELYISGHGSHSCPTWLGSKLSLKGLKSLHLSGVEWEDLPSLGQMSVLHELELEHMSTLKDFGPCHFGIITEESFYSLTSLKLVGLEGLENWVMGDHGHLLSQLKVLIIADCPNLSGLPFEDNTLYPPKQDGERKVHLFPNLQEFQIWNCPKVLSLPPIPWTQTLSSIRITESGSQLLRLEYEKSPSNVKLEIAGKDDLRNLDEVLVFSNLTDLQKLALEKCPALESRQLQMLISLEHLWVECSDHLYALSTNEDEVEWQIPVKDLGVCDILDTGKELSQLLPHLPKLSKLTIKRCRKITQMGATVVQQQPTTHVQMLSASSHQQQIAEQVQEIEEEIYDEPVLLPAHLSDSLRVLTVHECPELSLLASPLPPNNSSTAGRGGEGGGLQALRSLQRLKVDDCPKFLSAYNKFSSFSSSCFPFPSWLKELELWNIEGMGTLEPLANLISLTHLYLYECGKDLRSDGLWPLVTQGQLMDLDVTGSPRFFVGSDPMQGLKDEDQVQLLRRSSKLQRLVTDDAAGFLTKPICRILSSSLTRLVLYGNDDVFRFTEEQEEALQLFTSLESLQFDDFPNLQCLPTGLHTLSKLEELQIMGCGLVDSFPRDGLPSSLQKLVLYHCSNELIQQCRNYVDDHPGIKLRRFLFSS